MTVFKTYFKIVKNFFPTIFLYLTIFMSITIIMMTSTPSGTTFQSEKPKVYIQNEDSSSFTDTFLDYVEENCEVVKLESTKEKLEDALFYREVDNILKIPNGYGKSFIEGTALQLETISVPNSINGAYTEKLLNDYFRVYQTYLAVGMNETEIGSLVLEDLKQKTKVELLESSTPELERVSTYYNYTNYVILAVCILIIGMITNEFTEKKIQKRNFSSPTSYHAINRSLLYGNICLTALIWLSYVIISMILYPNTMFSAYGILYCLNSFVFSIMALSLGFLIGNLVRNREAQSGIVNVIALGTSFLCGVFVPREFLGESVVQVSKIFPSYWFVSNNIEIGAIYEWNFKALQPIFVQLGIVLGFAIFFFFLTNLFVRIKQKHN